MQLWKDNHIWAYSSDLVSGIAPGEFMKTLRSFAKVEETGGGEQDYARDGKLPQPGCG